MKLDTVNRRIVESLQRDGRRAFTDIARELGISEAAVRARVHKLTEEGVIEIVAVTNPLMVGFDVMAMIGVRADGHLQRIADEVGAWDESSYVVILSGSLDLLVEVVCADNRHLLDVIERLRGVDGVTSTETFLYLDLHKQTFTWGARETD
jgi:Lrp/AsnC family transcriptional regulator for asnA, asnC and gidA